MQLGQFAKSGLSELGGFGPRGMRRFDSRVWINVTAGQRGQGGNSTDTSPSRVNAPSNPPGRPVDSG